MDLLTGWDFDKAEDREMAEWYVRTHKPTFLIGSPMCTMFSQLQNLNKDRDVEKFEERLKNAEKHIQFVVKLYRMQLEGGRYFIHEHPASASSWKLPCMRDLWKEKGVHAVIADQCEFGLKSRDKWGDAQARKPTRFMTNAHCVGETLDVRCQNAKRNVKEQHRHVQLIGATRAHDAQEYPKELCEAIVRGT